MFCKKCGKEIMDEAVICVHCGCSTQEKTAELANNDAPNTGMAVLGFFIPIVGLIIWLINRDTKPLMAKSAGKGALIGFAVSMVCSIFYGMIVGSMFSSIMYY